ncbi:MAG: metal-sensitive transcriptional regulator [Candidatus Nitrosopolaris sp.]
MSKRLARIEGHVRGVQRMVNEDKSYADIVQQICAVPRSSRWRSRSDGSGFGRALRQPKYG